MARFINPIPQYILSDGDVAAAGTITFYEFNTDTLLTIYGDEDETITITNPVTLGDRGEVPNVFFSVAARAVLADSAGNEIFDVQPVSTAGGGSGGISGWLANSTYSQLAIVFGSDGDFYISNVNDNVANDPASDTDDSPYWTRLDFLRKWNEQESYEAGVIVIRNQKMFASQISDNVGNDPSIDTLGNWLDLSDASVAPYSGSSSGLSAETVKTAIDQLKVIIDAIVQPFAYLGTLDVSGGDPSLPVSPSNGDLYVIGVGGTITVSSNGAAAVSTAVTVGQRITWNNADSRWDLLPFSQVAADISYSNVTSGLAASNVQQAIDEIDDQVDTNVTAIAGINATLSGLGSGVTYRGVLDVSTGDPALPSAPDGGDLYTISVGGTITVSVNGGSPVATAVTAGQQIIYNDNLIQWDLLLSITSAGEISYDNSTSGLSAVDVQGAIDENAADVAELLSKDDLSVQFANGTATVVRLATVNDFTKTGTGNVVTTVDESDVVDGDIFIFRKPLEAGSLTINTTSNQTLPDGTTDTSNVFNDGTAGTVELKFLTNTWYLRIY